MVSRKESSFELGQKKYQTEKFGTFIPSVTCIRPVTKTTVGNKTTWSLRGHRIFTVICRD